MTTEVNVNDVELGTNFLISGFWRRAGAFFIDSILLGVLGVFLGTFLGNFFVQLGGWGRAVGFLIGAFYFSILNSKLGGGQTIGKKSFKIQVIKRDSSHLTLLESFLRYSIFGIPYFLNGAQFTEGALTSISGCLASFVVFGIGLSIVYLIFFNRRTRQSLHDIALGTFVIHAGVGQKICSKSIWPVHYMVCILLCLLSILGPFVAERMINSETFGDLRDTRNEIITLPEVAFVVINDGKSFFTSLKHEENTSSYISTNVFLKTDQILDEVLAIKIADLILKKHKEAHNRGFIRVTLVYGYDLGIYSSWKTNTYYYSPAEWENKRKKQSK
jgi:uncharacterized RDD family membrane protein YckC